jgi:serine/threonine protein kinase
LDWALWQPLLLTSITLSSSFVTIHWTQYLKQKTDLEVPDLKSMSIGVCGGVKALHELNIVHRNLKPSNALIYLSSGGKVIPKISDFGISIWLDGDTDITGKGTINWMSHEAPEVLNGLLGGIALTTKSVTSSLWAVFSSSLSQRVDIRLTVTGIPGQSQTTFGSTERDSSP